MGVVLHLRQVQDRLELQNEELTAFSADFDAFCWEIEEALRHQRHQDGGGAPADLQKLSLRAATVLAALDAVRSVLPPRLETVVAKAL